MVETDGIVTSFKPEPTPTPTPKPHHHPHAYAHSRPYSLPHRSGLPGLPISKHGVNKAVTLDFTAPARCDLEGGYLMKTLARPVYVVDMVMTMPASCIAPRDHVSHR